MFNVGGTSIHLSVKEYDLLNFLMRHSGRVLERQEIMRGVWGENFFGDDNLLDVYIRYLRQKIEIDKKLTLIHTIRGVEFILQAQETTLELIIAHQILHELRHQKCHWVLSRFDESRQVKLSGIHGIPRLSGRQAKFKVQMRTCAQTGAPDSSNHFALLHHLTSLHIEL